MFNSRENLYNIIFVIFVSLVISGCLIEIKIRSEGETLECIKVTTTPYVTNRDDNGKNDKDGKDGKDKGGN